MLSQNILNIVFISLYYKPIWPGFGTRYAELLTDESAKCGHNVTMLTGKIPKNLNVDDVYRQKIFTESMGKGKVKTIRLWSTNLDHEGFLNRIIAYSTFMFQCFFKILFFKNIDVLMALHPFPPFFFPILLICKLKKIKFIVNITDLWPDNFIELGVIKNQFIYSIIKKLCIFVYENSDTAIISNDELKTGISKYFSNKEKMFILPQATNVDIFKPVSIAKEIFPDKFIVMYAGIFSPNYDFDIIINSAKLLESNNKIIFILSGAGELKNILEKKILKSNLSNIKILDPVDTIDEVVLRLNQADVLVLGMNDNQQSHTGTPSKMFEYMACKKPVISATHGAAEQILRESNGGIIVTPGNSQEFADAVLTLFNNPDQMKLFANNGYNYIIKFRNLNIFRKKLNQIITH